ncbi:MAG: hypothetical protein AAB481_00730 [Patescibacteria group bacterium]
MKRLCLYLLIGVFLCLVSKPVFALYDPTSVPNNKFGMLIVDTNDIAELPELLNSTDGDWGYVTLVIPDSDRSRDKWQRIFDQLRRLHLIPIVRLATHIQGTAWSKPNENDTRDWTQFLSSLNWPVENRYVVIFNEPNHAKEWGNTIDPEGYAKVLVTFAKELKAASEDFFILPAGLDASAASDGQSLDEAAFLTRMKQSEPTVFESIDGWSSHSYPNPGFSGSPSDSEGRGTLRTYQWEQGVLRTLGLSKNLPVFITETGWQHSQGKYINSRLLSPETVGTYLAQAATFAWSDPVIAAVTPFIFNYQDTLFDHFSWRQFGASSYYPHYYAYQAIPKQKGTPKQRESYQVDGTLLPTKLVTDSTYTFTAILKNAGQGILDLSDGYTMELDDESKSFIAIIDPLPYLEPGQTGTINLHLQSPKKPGSYPVRLLLVHNSQSIPILERSIDVVPPPSITIQASLGWRKTSDAGDVQVLIYDKHTLIQKFTGLRMIKGKILVPELTNIVPESEYRIVVLVPKYLPRQYIGILGEKLTTITIKRLLPLDFNEDGAFTMADIIALVRFPPKAILQLFVGP